MTEQEQLNELVKMLSSTMQADIFLFSATIVNQTADRLIQAARKIPKRQKNVVLILTTYGGDADAAFRIMSFLQRKYEKITLFVFGYCKSAGTLMALGAHQIVMSDFGEFGPLDVQVFKSDELYRRESGLDIHQALDLIGSQAYTMFEDYFLQLIERSQGVISTRTAADIASSMAVQLLAPIAGQIDPLRLGEMNRVMQIAQDYGQRLSCKSLDQDALDQYALEIVTKLSSEYHAHGFVIDYTEAEQLFGEKVREPTEIECLLEDLLFGVVRAPTDRSIVEWLGPATEEHQKGDEDEDDESEGVSEGNTPRAVSGDNGQGKEDQESHEFAYRNNNK